MTGGSCLTFQLPTPSRQQPHPRAWRELGLGQRGGRFPGSASLGQLGLGWSPGEAEQGWAGQEASLLRCSLQPPRFSQPLGLQLHQVLGGQHPQVLLLAPPASHAAGPRMQTGLS